MSDGEAPSRPPAPAGLPLTMADVAQRAGVSAATVSRALSGSPLVSEGTRARVRAVAAEAGYAVNSSARALRMRRAGAIEVLIPIVEARGGAMSDPFFLDMIGALSDALTARGHDMLLSTRAPWGASGRADPILAGRADGVIVIGQGGDHEGLCAYARQHAAVAVWGARTDGLPYPVVGSDNPEGGRLATEHRLSGGRRRVAFAGPLGEVEVDQRAEGYAAAMRAAGLTPRLLDVGATRAAHRDALATLFEDEAPDGLVCASDLAALGAVAAARAAGLSVPGDVGITGYDDVYAGAFASPPLTTISQSLRDGADALVAAVLAGAAGEAPRGAVLPPRLVVRESCGVR